MSNTISIRDRAIAKTYFKKAEEMVQRIQQRVDDINSISHILKSVNLKSMSGSPVAMSVDKEYLKQLEKALTSVRLGTLILHNMLVEKREEVPPDDMERLRHYDNLIGKTLQNLDDEFHLAHALLEGTNEYAPSSLE